MRIAFNGLFLENPGNGSGQYAYHLLEALGRVDGINEYVILTPHEVRDKPDTSSSFTWQTAPVGQLGRGGASLEKLIWEQHTFPMAAKRENARVMHVPYFAPPLLGHGVPRVVSIRDVIGLRLPAYRASPAAAAYNQLVARAAKQANMVITISEFSKRDIMEVLGIPEDRIRVVLLAPAPRFKRIVDASRLREARERYGFAERFVLYVGGLDQRKNVSTLVGAFAGVYHAIGDPGLQLVISGDPGKLGSSQMFPDWRPLAETLGIADHIRCTYVAQDDLPLIYSATSCFVFPSLYEGFGLTPLEAMACGAPVVCSERTSLPEVVGRAGILVNPEDPDALSGAIQRVLTSPGLREDLRARAQAHVKRYTWTQAAVDTSAVYADVMGTRV
ncbi:MAG TPA: glycosyltransferase family 1 protein [Ktedonobacterales bacterium]|jgi:glycosyltransferase involved in cell wall biosynthesis|nr:glycosyltransferase family 1 protein [Ktedonobacterales bacterium]